MLIDYENKMMRNSSIKGHKICKKCGGLVLNLVLSTRERNRYIGQQLCKCGPKCSSKDKNNKEEGGAY